MELGVNTFVDNQPDVVTGEAKSNAQRVKELLAEVELAEKVGLDVFGIGEHHRVEYVASAPAALLAAAAARTERIRLTSAVTVLSSSDPVRVFQDFATVDLISNGRAEIMAGRGSFIESFPLFGEDLNDYDSLFSEKLELLLKIRDSEYVTWSGQHRAAIDNLAIYPRPVQDPLPVWIAVGGTPESVFRAGSLGLPLAIAIIGGMPVKFAPLVQLYKEAGAAAGVPAHKLKVSINAHGHIAATTQEAADQAYPYNSAAMNKIGQERGWGPQTREQFDASSSSHGALLIGDPETVAAKIIAHHKHFNQDRYVLQFTTGNMPHEHVMQAIELLGTEVKPIVDAEIPRDK